MTSKHTSLTLDVRTGVGKTELKKLRAEEMVPVVIHDHGKPSITGMAKELTLIKAYQEVGKNHPIELTIGDQNYLALVKDVHYNPVKNRMQHIVFMAVNRNEKVEAEIPVEYISQPAAERVGGLMVVKQLDTVLVQALPDNLPDHFEVDGEKLAELGDKITVGDLKVPEGVEIMTDLEQPIAMVVETREMISDEEKAADEAAATEASEASASESAETEKTEE